TVSAPTTARSSKLAAATVITTVPDLTPVMRPCASTAATLGSLLDQRNTTLGIGCESAGPRICHACAVAMVSVPRSRMRTGVMLTWTDASCSVGYMHLVMVAELNSIAKTAPRPTRMCNCPAHLGPTY